MERNTGKVHFQVWDKDFMSSDDPNGEAELDLQELLHQKEVTKVIDLYQEGTF